MMKAFEHICKAALALAVMLALLALLSVSALAAEANGDAVDTVEVTENGTVTVISGHAAGEMVSSVQVRIGVSPAEGGTVGFTFDGGLAGRLTNSSYRDGILSIYIAGTAPLMAPGQDRLALGTVTGADLASVQLPEDALQFVYGRRVIAQSADAELVGIERKADEPEQTTVPAPAPGSEIRSKLQTALEQAKGLDPAGYTQTSYAELLAAIEKAEAVLADPNAAETDLSAAAAGLQEAVDRLVPVASPDGSGPVIGDDQDDGSGAGGTEPGPDDSGADKIPAVTTVPAADDDGPDISPEFNADATNSPAPTANGQSSAPNTGDSSYAAAWAGLLCLCGLMLAGILRRRKTCR